MHACTRFKRADGTMSGVLMMSPSKELQNVLVEKTSQWVDRDSAKVDESRIVCP